MLHTSRASLACQVAVATRSLVSLLKTLSTTPEPNLSAEKDGDGLLKRLQQDAANLAVLLTCQRHYVVAGGLFTFDPRFLVTEYVFDLVLRARQVEVRGGYEGGTRGVCVRIKQVFLM